MSVTIEGYTPDEILQFSESQLSEYLFTEETLLIHVGTARILGNIRKTETTLTIELAHIEGGGEGVLPTLWVLANQYAKQQGLTQVEWILHALTCAEPNLKLRRMLERRGFVVKMIEEIGEAYYLCHDL